MGNERRRNKQTAKRREDLAPASGPAWRAIDFLGLAALVALAVAWASWPLGHDDLFGHLRTGEWIVQNGKVPLTDPFSFTRPGMRWITHEWGFSLLTWGVERLGGLAGLMALRVLIVLAIGGVLAWRMRTESEARSPLLDRRPARSRSVGRGLGDDPARGAPERAVPRPHDAPPGLVPEDGGPALPVRPARAFPAVGERSLRGDLWALCSGPLHLGNVFTETALAPLRLRLRRGGPGEPDQSEWLAGLDLSVQAEPGALRQRHRVAARAFRGGRAVEQRGVRRVDRSTVDRTDFRAPARAVVGRNRGHPDLRGAVLPHAALDLSLFHSCPAGCVPDVRGPSDGASRRC